MTTHKREILSLHQEFKKSVDLNPEEQRRDSQAAKVILG